MKPEVRCWMVISPNGYISKPDGNEDWISEVNWDDFVAGCQACDNFIVGRTTYDVVPELDEVKAKQKVIVTKDRNLKPKSGYKVVHSPQAAVDYLKEQGVSEILLAGGGGINTSFAKAGLIDVLDLIVEPYVIGNGKQVLAIGDYEFPLQLKEVKKLSNGRVKLLYKVGKP